jgi:CHAT domain-containing protein/tetratricopeptide (TPR) repeat protein
MEHPLAAGEEHSYVVKAVSGRPFLVVAQQRGIDVELRVKAPDGRDLVWVDRPNGSRGPERVAIRPEVSGGYSVIVMARQRGTVSGSYRLELSDLQELTDRERSRVAAELADSRATDLFRKGGRDAWRLAAEEARKALSHWQDAGDEPGHTFLLLGVLNRLLDDLGPALEALEKARVRFESEHSIEGQAAAWNEIGYAHWQAGHPELAREAYDRALTHWRLLGHRQGEAQALNNLGLVSHSQGELRPALERYESAAVLYQTAGELSQAALVHNNRAGVWELLGEPRRALEGYRKALELMRQTGERSQEPRLLFNLAVVHRALGELQEALSGYRQALDLFRLQGDRRGEGTALNGLGMAYLSLGEYQRSLDILQQALILRREAGDRRGEALNLHNLSILLSRQGVAKRALDLLRQSLELRESLGDRLGRASCLEQIGSFYSAQGDPAEALRNFEQALEIRRAVGDPVGQGRAITSAAEARLSLEEPQQAAASLQEALKVLRAASDRSGEARALVVLARAERALGKPAQALARLNEAFERIEALRSRVASPELRASYLAAQREAFELAVEIRLDLHRLEPTAGHDRAALEVSERARARSLLDLLARDGDDVPSGIDPSLAQRRQLLRERAGAKETRRLVLLASDAPPQRRQEVERELEAVLLELQLLEEEIARGASEPTPEAARTASVAEIQGLVNGGALLLEYALGEKRSVLWAVSSSSVEVFELPGRKEIEELATRVYRRWSTLDTGAPDDGGAAELSRMLLGPVAGRLADQRLLVVPDGALHYLPYMALPRPGTTEPLLVRHEVVILPSASFLVAQRRALSFRPTLSRGVAVLADPVFDPRDPRVRGVKENAASESKEAVRGAAQTAEEDLPLFDRLALSRREAEAIAEVVHGEPMLLALDFQARRSLVTDGSLSAYRVLHFATHGTFHGEHPELSGIVLSLVDSAGLPQEGFLRLPDLRGLSLKADLVVLSGCRTALGREIRGEGLVGLSRGFFDAGARNVVASLWQVPDRATAELMSQFYRTLARPKTSPAAALREAQLAIRARRGWSEPYHWASFVVIGEGQ